MWCRRPDPPSPRLPSNRVAPLHASLAGRQTNSAAAALGSMREREELATSSSATGGPACPRAQLANRASSLATAFLGRGPLVRRPPSSFFFFFSICSLLGTAQLS